MYELVHEMWVLKRLYSHCVLGKSVFCIMIIDYSLSSIRWRMTCVFFGALLKKVLSLCLNKPFSRCEMYVHVEQTIIANIVQPISPFI